MIFVYGRGKNRKDSNIKSKDSNIKSALEKVRYQMKLKFLQKRDATVFSLKLHTRFYKFKEQSWEGNAREFNRL